MEAIITPSKAVGNIRAIASKSVAHRLLICSAFSDKETVIRCEKTNKDIIATTECLRAIGACIDYADGYFKVIPSNRKTSNGILPCNESGSTLRFILPIAAAIGGKWSFIMSGRLSDRPLSPLKEELESHGISFEYISKDELCIQGKLNCGEYTIRGDVSSQFVSGLLFALSLINGTSILNVTGNIESAPYIEMTLSSLKDFNANISRQGNTFTIEGKKLNSPQEVDVEGDWSNAAFPLCAAALGGNVTLDNISTDSNQGDIKILDLLEEFGADVIKSEKTVTVVGNRELHGIRINAEQIPDLVPVIATVASGAKGQTVITGASRLRIKESDRLKTTYELLSTLGADITLNDDGFVINGKSSLNGGVVSSYNDHRIAMCAAVASVICRDKVVLNDAGAVSKSYPDFWKDFSNLGLKIEIVD